MHSPAAVQGNGQGIAGVCPNARIMSLKVSDSRGKVLASNIFRAYEYAASMGAHIASSSFTSKQLMGKHLPAVPTRSEQIERHLFEKALTRLQKRGVLCVAAAGRQRTARVPHT